MCDVVRGFDEERPLGIDLHVVVSSLKDFWDELRLELPRHPEAMEAWHGDWPDYWALGLGAAPEEVKSIQRAQTMRPMAQALHQENDRDR